MATYATSSKQWTQEALEKLPREGAFRLRGLEVTRLDTFVDAAFAFVLTILVISFDDIPSNYPEMLEAIKRIPGFFFSFGVLMIFWLNHRSWSRRFGLENTATLLISLAIIFTILVYVYPLRMVFESMFYWLSDGFFTSTFEISSSQELRAMFLYYSVGFLIMSILFSMLNSVTLRASEPLGMDAQEFLGVKVDIGIWLICSATAVASILLAVFLNDAWVPLAGFVYTLVYPLILATDKILRSR